MQIILYLSVALIAIAFLVLVIFLAATLKSFQVTLTSVSKTLIGLEKQLDGVTAETTLLLHKTNALADDIQQKSESLTSVVEAVKDVGTTVTKFNGTLQNITKSVDIHVEESKEKISQIVQWGNVFLELKDKLQARRQAKNEISLNEGRKVRSH
ncbi:MAG: DUF948 domain-containing protein [Bacillus sp. (in: firmicutes)]